MLGETREAEEWARAGAREGVKAVACMLSVSKKDRRRLEQREARSAGRTSRGRGRGVQSVRVVRGRRGDVGSGWARDQRRS